MPTLLFWCIAIDHNAAANIKNRADGHAVLKAQRLLSNSRID
jgi:putative transposase